MKLSRRGGSFFGFLATLVLGCALGAGVCSLAINSRSAPAPVSTPVEAPAAAPDPVADAPASEDAISRKLREWNLTPEDLKRDLANARDIVREKSHKLGEKSRELGERVKAATADVTIIAKIKAKYTLDDQLSALAIIVDCKDGHVKLSGNVASLEMVGRAIVLALDTDGVSDVVSTLKVDVKPDLI